MSQIDKLPEIIVFASTNGSGKSTITRLAKIIEPYINADDIKIVVLSNQANVNSPSFLHRYFIKK